jgi:hypothetical protein
MCGVEELSSAKAVGPAEGATDSPRRLTDGFAAPRTIGTAGVDEPD